MSRIAALLAPLLLALPITPLTAQEPAGSTCAYEVCAVRHTSSFFGERLVRGSSSEQVLKIGFTGGNAADFLSRVPGAERPARDFKARRTRSAILGLLGAVAAGYVASKAWDNDADITSSDETILWAGIGVGILSGIEGWRARDALSRAVWEFNRAPVR
jgi:hypothetical protein